MSLPWFLRPFRKPLGEPASLGEDGPCERAIYHGGVATLTIGDKIIPRAQNPDYLGKIILWRNNRPAEDFGDVGDTVSLTTDLRIARGYAGEYVSPRGQREEGAVYKVLVGGTSEVDPDFPASYPTISRFRGSVEIVDIVEKVPIQSNPRVITRALGSHFVYATDHSPLYDPNGFFRPTPVWERFGASEDDLKKLGPWFPLHLLQTDQFRVPSEIPPTL